MEPEEITRKEFLISLRGYDRDEVDAFLQEIADELRSLRSAAQVRVEQPSGGDREAMYRQVGEETAKILLAAEEAAQHIRERAQEEMAGLIADARAQAQELSRQSAAERQEAEDDLRQLRDARSVLATQLQDVRQRIDEIISRLSGPIEAAAPVPKRTRGKRTETATPTTSARSARAAPAPEATREPAPAVVEPELMPAPEFERAPDIASGPEARVVEPETRVAEPEVVPKPREMEVEREPIRAAAADVELETEAAPTAEAEAPSEADASPTARLQSLLEEARRERESARREIEDVISQTSPRPDAPKPSTGFQEVKPAPRGFVEAPRAPDVSPTTTSDIAVPATARPLSADAGVIESRDSALGDLPAASARRLKRLLQEDENDLLDRIRISRGQGSFDDDISPLDLHLRRFREGLRETLEEAFVAGRKSAQTSGPGGGSVTVGDLISKQIVNPLRKEVSRVVEGGMAAQDTTSSIAGRASDVFRVWKGVRTELLGEGLAHSAFHHGMLDAWRERDVPTKRWIHSQAEAECPKGVCTSNAAAGPVPIDDTFPSGHLAPPAHGGCDCSLSE